MNKRIKTPIILSLILLVLMSSISMAGDLGSWIVPRLGGLGVHPISEKKKTSYYDGSVKINSVTNNRLLYVRMQNKSSSPTKYGNWRTINTLGIYYNLPHGNILSGDNAFIAGKADTSWLSQATVRGYWSSN